MAEKCGYENTHTGKPCGRTAGWGTDHTGSGYCVDHDETFAKHTGSGFYRLDKERQEGIAMMLEQGHSVSAACAVAKIDRGTFYRWMQAGEHEEEGPAREFYDRITEARGFGILNAEKRLAELVAEKNDASTWLKWMGMVYPDTYKQSDSVDKERSRLIYRPYVESDSDAERVNLNEQSAQ